MQIIQLGLSIVVIPTITEWVIGGIEIRAGTVVPGSAVVAPSVIRIRQNLGSTCIIDCDDITLQILLEIEGVEGIGGVACGPVLHPDGGTAFGGFDGVDSARSGVDVLVAMGSAGIIIAYFLDSVKLATGSFLIFSTFDSTPRQKTHPLLFKNADGIMNIMPHSVSFF